MSDFMNKPTLERNDPCWCGSGKKYKKCHLRADMEKETGSRPKKPLQPETMVKSDAEIDGMRKAGAFNGELMDYIRPFVKVGVSTEELDRIAHEFTVKHGHIPACLGYHGYPKSICASINNIVCHGIPSSQDILKDGDIVNIDFTTIVNGFYGDSSETFMMGAVSAEARRLVDATAKAMEIGINAALPGTPLSAIGNAIEPFVKSQGFSVVHQYTGHGIGKSFHEFFNVYHHIDKDCDNVILHPGMTITIEPMVNAGGYKVITDTIDKWTVRTEDGSLSAQFEHTILITDAAPEILTLTPSQRKIGKMTII
jgi:methionyl aminopeptidase